MNLPKQAEPVIRNVSDKSGHQVGIAPSCCPGGKQCYGICIFGTCTGVCA